MRFLAKILGTSIAKNALIFAKELLQARARLSPNFLKSIVRAIYEKSVNDKNFIKNEAKQAVKFLESNYISEDILKEIDQICAHHNPLIEENGCLSLLEIYKIHKNAILADSKLLLIILLTTGTVFCAKS